MIRNALITLLVLAATAAAKNVDLVTLPDRASVQLTIYNSDDITLVKETRSLTFKKGLNQLQFSWANTLIDPTSVEFRPLEHEGEIQLLDTVFPGQKPQHCIWNVESAFEGQVRVEVSYFTSGLTWSMDYVAVTDPSEKRMDFRGFVRVFNSSGEDYENAEVRLIVGRINLVEKIADLARRRGIPVPGKGSLKRAGMRRDSAKAAFFAAESASRQEGMSRDRKAIVKEGLSEYFMFSVSGTETIRNGWSKRMRAIHAKDHKFDIVYRMRAHQYGPRPVRFFIWRNDAEHELGDSPLPDGTVRLFRGNGAGGQSFLGEQRIRYVPVKAAIEINLGVDDLVVYESRRASTVRFEFSFRKNGNKEYVTGWDEKSRFVDIVRNYRKQPIRLELRRVWAGHIDYTSEIDTKLFDYHTIETSFTVASRGKIPYPCTVVSHLGSHKKQERVRLR